jgi:hypothetical protein
MQSGANLRQTQLPSATRRLAEQAPDLIFLERSVHSNPILFDQRELRIQPVPEAIVMQGQSPLKPPRPCSPQPKAWSV